MIRKVLKNDYAFALFTKVLCIVLGFVYTILLSRYLGPSLRGEYSIVQNYGNIISIFIGFGIYHAYPYLKRKLNNSEGKQLLYKNILRNVLGLFLVYVVICLIIYFLFPLNMRAKTLLLIIPTIYLYKQLNYILLIEHPRKCNQTDVILSFIDVITITILMLLSHANILLCFGLLVFNKLIYALLPLKNIEFNLIKNFPKIDNQLSKYIKFGFLPMLTVILMTFNHKIDIVMLSFFKNVTISEIGIYSLGVMLAEKVWMLPDTLTNILQSKLAGGKNKEEVAKISRISFTITAICLILVALFGKQLIILAYGIEYADAYRITLVIMFGVLGMTFYKVVYAYNIVIGKRKLNFILLSMSVVINIIFNIILILKLGVIGAGYASLISFVLCGFAFLYSFSKNTKISVLDMIILKKEDIILLRSLIVRNSGDKIEK